MEIIMKNTCKTFDKELTECFIEARIEEDLPADDAVSVAFFTMYLVYYQSIFSRRCAQYSFMGIFP